MLCHRIKSESPVFIAFDISRVKGMSLALVVCLFGSTAIASASVNVTSALTARTILIDDNAFSASSVNVLAGTRQTLFTDSIYQYAAFYNADGKVVVAKRRLGDDHWEKRVTSYTGNVSDAHNHLSLIIDGEGYLHLAWDHHNTVLKYARSIQPGSLVLEKAVMLADDRIKPQMVQEHSVTYPQFYRLKSGDLLFAYRDGGSGRGTLVLNRYNTGQKRWQRLHSSLIDGEGERSAYWDMSLDSNGVLHLAWIWRETPDVASNHDIAYAQSRDEGKTWTRIDGSEYKLPITRRIAELAWPVPQNHKLMNPPVIAADGNSNPFIASYWADSPGGKPRYHVLYHRQASSGWQVITALAPAHNFSLSGTGTKRPPLSRAALLVEPKGRFHLIFRDDFSDGNIIAATVDSLDTPVWRYKRLMDENTGAWEPSVDPELWRRLQQVHLLLQKVDQLDGNDVKHSQAAANAIKLLIWSPNWERHQELSPVQGEGIAENLTKPLIKRDVLQVAEKAADWQWRHMVFEGHHYHPRGWAQAPFLMGNLAIAPLLSNSDLEQRVVDYGDTYGWAPHRSLYDADDHAIVQPYLTLYLRRREAKMLTASKQRFDQILEQPSPSSMDWGNPDSRHRWTWSDSLFMGPNSWLLMYRVTGNDEYLKFMDEEWAATTERLYRPEIGLYFRDESYLDVREPNGKTLHWSRGTGWSIAGLARVLENYPQNREVYEGYTVQFKQMAAAFANAQQSDGLWRPGLLDPNTHTAKESSGSSFAVFALAWGINHGLLDKQRYFPAVVKGWNALVNCVTDDGKLEHVQPIGAAPHGFDPANTEPFAVGAFLLAASEVAELGQ